MFSQPRTERKTSSNSCRERESDTAMTRMTIGLTLRRTARRINRLKGARALILQTNPPSPGQTPGLLLLSTAYKTGIATAEMAIINRKTLRRPRASDIQPERIRPDAFPMAPTKRPMAANAALETPWLLAKGMSWLITIRPADVPRA